MMKQTKGNKKFPLLLLFFGAVVVSFMLSFFMGENGILRLQQLNDEYERQRLQNFRMAVENRKLLDEIRKLRHDSQAVEKIAREELRFVSPDDTVLIVPEPDGTDSTSVTR